MKEKEKGPSEIKSVPDCGAPLGTNPMLADAAKLLAAGDEIISRTLSNDSAQFLFATRQSGGQ
jgi:hypothetical protein